MPTMPPASPSTTSDTFRFIPGPGLRNAACDNKVEEPHNKLGGMEEEIDSIREEVGFVEVVMAAAAGSAVASATYPFLPRLP
jgi:hypothetical protein